jgi:hypothetical protein
MNNILVEPLSGHDLTGISMFFFLFIGAALGLLIHCYFNFRKERLDAEIKLAMIARGYTAQEIVEVIGAKTGASATNLPDVPPAKPIKPAGYGV